MMFKKMCRALEAMEKSSPQKTKTLLKRTYLDSKDEYFLKLLARKGHSREAYVRKIIPKTFQIFEKEVETLYAIHGDYGSVVYRLDKSAEADFDYPVSTIYNILINKEDLSEYLLNMSALERKWLIRLCESSKHMPRKDMLLGVMSSIFEKDREEVMRHCNYSSINNVIEYYHKNMIPPSTIKLGSFITPMQYSIARSLDSFEKYYCRINYGVPYLQLHIRENKRMLFNRKGDIVFDEEINDLELPLNSIFEINKVNGIFIIVDVLMLENKLMINETFENRLASISDLDNIASYTTSGYLSEYNLSIGSGYEGIYLYLPQKTYSSGEVGNKIKYNPSNLEVFGVITSTNNDRFGNIKSYYISLPNDGSFLEIGNFDRVGSKEDSLRLSNALRRHTNDYKNNRHYYSPRVVVKIKTSGLAYKNDIPTLKDVRFISICDDMYVNECTSLSEMEAI